jgi:hypothetical protein
MINKKLIETYQELKKELNNLETQIKDIQKIILDEIDANNELRIDDIIVKHSQYEQEYFKLKDAIEVLDKRMLKPFITIATIDKVIIKKAA